jgi:hypothetical protein
MNITIQPTGHMPQVIATDKAYNSTQMLEGDKRGVQLQMGMEEEGGWFAAITYITSWGTERTFVRLEHGAIGVVCDWVRAAAKIILPPGAGFPATPQFETRQSKLAGMLETLTLVALSEVLAEVHKDGQ